MHSNKIAKLLNADLLLNCFIKYSTLVTNLFPYDVVLRLREQVVKRFFLWIFRRFIHVTVFPHQVFITIKFWNIIIKIIVWNIFVITYASFFCRSWCIFFIARILFASRNTKNLFDYINYIKYVLEIFRKGPCMATLSIFEIWYNFC